MQENQCTKTVHLIFIVGADSRVCPSKRPCLPASSVNSSLRSQGIQGVIACNQQGTINNKPYKPAVPLFTNSSA